MCKNTCIIIERIFIYWSYIVNYNYYLLKYTMLLSKVCKKKILNCNEQRSTAITKTTKRFQSENAIKEEMKL